MSLLEYLLAGLIGTSWAAGLPGAAPQRTLGPEAIGQPNGGVLLASPQSRGGAENPTESPTKHKSGKNRRSHKHRRHPKPNAITVKQT